MARNPRPKQLPSLAMGKRGNRFPTSHILPEHEGFFTPMARPIRRPLEPKTDNQRRYINAINNFVLTFGIGPAGTGKTYIAGCLAAEALSNREKKQVIITRPAVESGQTLGLLPGELSDKFEPFLKPFRDVMVERLGLSQYEAAIKNEKISPQPLNYMRGSTFSDAFVVFDEAQNCTPAEMKMFLTRIGENCTVVINGDIEQCDLPGPSGLEDAVNRISYIPVVKVIQFTEDDSVRSSLVREILKAYRP